MSLLSCSGLQVAYGRTQILFGVDLEVDAGEVLAVLGTNGAGKSTLLRAISGLTAPEGGKVVFDGKDTTGASPVKMARLGLSHMPGGRGIFPDLTVGENLRMATWVRRRDRKRSDAAQQRALDLFPALAGRLSERAGLLSGGQQQMLALAQALMPEPRLLMIDELSLGLAPVVVAELLEVVRHLRDDGLAILLVEQSAELALQVADRAVFLEKGEARFSGPAAEVARRDDLVRSIFLSGAAVHEPGRDGNAEPARRAVAGTGTAISCRGLRKRFGGLTAVDGVDLDIAPGEIVGLMGPNGAGKTTVLDLLSGFVTPDEGTVSLAGRDVTALAPEARARKGLGRSFQDARLFPGLTTTETLAVSCERWVTSREPLAAALRLPASLLSEADVADRVARIINLLRLGIFADRFASELSTGSRRLVEFGCLLAQEPDVLLLDEPSAGLAQAEAEALGPVLRQIRNATGAALVLVEHDVPLLRASCDRLVALDAGRVICQGTPAEVLENPRVIEAYLGTAAPAAS